MRAKKKKKDKQAAALKKFFSPEDEARIAATYNDAASRHDSHHDQIARIQENAAFNRRVAERDEEYNRRVHVFGGYGLGGQ